MYYTVYLHGFLIDISVKSQKFIIKLNKYWHKVEYHAMAEPLKWRQTT